ncbi:MAG: universal stress protein, partial [Acidobacteriota bacterium]
MHLKIDKILIPTDFSACAEVALTQAVVLARLHQAELHFLHVVMSHEEDPYSLVYQMPEWQNLYARQKARCSEEMTELLAAIDLGDVAVRLHIEQSHVAAPAILDAAKAQGADLIVMGTHGRLGFRRFLLGSVAEEVVRSAPCPVLTVSEHSTPIRDNWPQRITVPIDFSEHSKLALRVAKQLAASPEPDGTQLDLVHVVEHPVYPNLYNPLADGAADDALPHIVRKVEQGIARFIEDTGGPDVACEIKVSEGRAA